MIISIKEFQSENPTNDIWKHLRYYSYTPSMCKYLGGLYPKAGLANIKKQAEQISFSIRQAQEYFDASKAVSLSTKPLLLYYGAVSLCQALILIRKEGTYSIDYLRKTKKHKHHGLNLADSIENLNKINDPSQILENISCNIHTREVEIDGTKKVIPWGNFGLFYDCLTPAAFAYNCTTKDSRYKTTTTTLILQPGADKQEILSLDKFNLLDLIRNLPELRSDLLHIGTTSKVYPGIFKYNQSFKFKK